MVDLDASFVKDCNIISSLNKRILTCRPDCCVARSALPKPGREDELRKIEFNQKKLKKNLRRQYYGREAAAMTAPKAASNGREDRFLLWIFPKFLFDSHPRNLESRKFSLTFVSLRRPSLSALCDRCCCASAVSLLRAHARLLSSHSHMRQEL